ncbi:hypothetical protein SISNIDRAFT_132267 [Sistotremastrum niveocremeum HHB9708]|uniref:Uncharacterized protein n=1 Tax=Sistotremastrum niveocremeum HHB9708 TaxID=1314777 RepID=A0A164T4J3_9AGAM|nr:hypothetical protein SISNIDRAFT_132267 [Sistotremastrum niveocremeum HHB9708]
MLRELWDSLMADHLGVEKGSIKTCDSLHQHPPPSQDPMIRFNVLCSVAIAIGLCVQPVVAGCPNGGTGIGFQQFCNINNPIEGPTCDQLYAVIAKDGTCNSNADKAVDNPSSSDLCGGGYTYGASVACQNGVPVTVNPPGEGITGPCREVSIECGGPLDNYQLWYCCGG